MDNNNEVNDSTIIETSEQDTELELVDIEDVEALKAKVLEKDKFGRMQNSRARKAEEEAKALKAKLASLEKPQTRTEPTDKVDSKVFDDALELRLQGYSKKAVDFILRNGGVESLKEDPYVKAAVESISTQEKAEKATATTIDSNKSDIEKKYTEEQLRNMSRDELLKILPKGR